MTADEPMSTPDTCPSKCAETHPGREHDESEDHHPRCYQRTGVPSDMPAGICDCRVLRMIDAAAPPDSADDATVGERERCHLCGPGYWIGDDGCRHSSTATPPAAGHPASPSCSERSCGQPPPADDANRATVSGGLDEGEREALRASIGSGRYAVTFEAVEGILAARDAAWVEQSAELHRELEKWEALAYGNGWQYDQAVARAEAAEAERDTARRDAGAKALRKVADEWLSEWDGGASHVARFLRDRADALTSDDGGGA